MPKTFSLHFSHFISILPSTMAFLIQRLCCCNTLSDEMEIATQIWNRWTNFVGRKPDIGVNSPVPSMIKTNTFIYRKLSPQGWNYNIDPHNHSISLKFRRRSILFNLLCRYNAVSFCDEVIFFLFSMHEGVSVSPCSTLFNIVLNTISTRPLAICKTLQFFPWTFLTEWTFWNSGIWIFKTSTIPAHILYVVLIFTENKLISSLQWRHNERNGVSNHVLM